MLACLIKGEEGRKELLVQSIWEEGNLNEACGSERRGHFGPLECAVVHSRREKKRGV